MTALVASLAFIPLLLATGTDSEIQKPLATVMNGGLVTSTAMILFALPRLYRGSSGKSRCDLTPRGDCLALRIEGADLLKWTGFGLELDRSMSDAEPFFQHPVDSIEKPGSFADPEIGHLDVATQGVDMRAETPDV